MDAQIAVEPLPNLRAGYPGCLELPAFLMCPPFSLSTDAPNNVWMEEYNREDRQIDLKKAISQFFALYHFVSSESAVYLLPFSPACGLQDLCYTANLAFVPEHLPNRDVAVLSRFTSQPRVGESAWGRRFFEALGYRVIEPPFRFEGDAEIKHLYENVYIGGYGQRSQREVYDWMQRELDMQVIALREVEPHLYHLDCSIFPITREDTLACTELFQPDELARIERVTNVIDVSADVCFNGICNSVRLNNLVLNASDILDHQAGTELYDYEIKKNRRLEDIAASLNLEVAYFNLSEFQKSGALLSCLMLHLNRFSSSVRLG